MSSKKPALGRGISQLLGDISADARHQPSERLVSLSVDALERGVYQPRRDFEPEALQELAESIKAQGIIQPLVVRPLVQGRYEVIAGERRWRAAMLAGLKQVPAIVREIPDQAAMAMALVENIQREDLNPMEEAYALQRLLDEFHLTHEQVAEAVGRSRTSVTNHLRLLQLHPSVKELLEKGQLTMGHARALLSLPLEQQIVVGQEAQRHQWTVRDMERYVRQINTPAVSPPVKKIEAQDPDRLRLQQYLSDRLGSTVEIHAKPNGTGTLVIHYYRLDQLDGLIEKITGVSEEL